MFVEDCEENQILYGYILEQAGAKVHFAENGEEALQLATSHAYDLVLMDMQMPIMDGYVATQTLRRRGFEAPIVALTAHARAEDRVKCLAIGCTEYLSKPADATNLIAVLERSLTNSSAPPLTVL